MRARCPRQQRGIYMSLAGDEGILHGGWKQRRDVVLQQRRTGQAHAMDVRLVLDVVELEEAVRGGGPRKQ